MYNLLINTLYRQNSGKLISYLINYCGLITYTNPLIDKINNYNFVKCNSDGILNVNGNYIKLESAYIEIVTADTTNILIDTSGNVKILEIANLVNNINNQFFTNFVNSELIKTSFYNNSLSGDCLVKAGKLLKINEPLIDKNGEVVSDKNGEIVYVYK